MLDINSEIQIQTPNDVAVKVSSTPQINSKNDIFHSESDLNQTKCTHIQHVKNTKDLDDRITDNILNNKTATKNMQKDFNKIFQMQDNVEISDDFKFTGKYMCNHNITKSNKPNLTKKVENNIKSEDK